MSFNTVDGIYTAFSDWMGNKLAVIDPRSILTMFNTYVTTKKLSASDQQLLRAGIQTNIEQAYAASMGDLSAANYDQVGKRGQDVIIHGRGGGGESALG